MAKRRRLALVAAALIFSVFLAGFLFGYFLERSGVAAARQETDTLKKSLESVQLEQLFLAQDPVKSCPVIIKSLGNTTETLYNLANTLSRTDPRSRSFNELKSEADILSIKAWLLAASLEDKCRQNVLAALLVSAVNCEACGRMNDVLQSAKTRFNQTLLVYAIDFNSSEPIISIVKDAYNVTAAPSLVIKGKVYGELKQAELESIACKHLLC